MQTKIDVRYVANLARIKLNPDEIKRLSQELESILKYMEKLRKLNLKNLSPTSHPLSISNVFREDKTTTCLPKGEVLRAAPDKEGDFFKVPRIIT